jgi:hypothetical protein
MHVKPVAGEVHPIASVNLTTRRRRRAGGHRDAARGELVHRDVDEIKDQGRIVF